MHRHEKEISDPQTIHAILQKAPVCRIALSESDRPYIVAVNFVVENGVLYFHSATTGRKIDILRQNASVCFVVDLPGDLIKGETACAWSMTYQSVIGFGRAFFVEETKDKATVLSSLMAKFAGPGSFSFPEDALDKVCVIGVKIDALSGKKSG